MATLFAANWKMHHGPERAAAFARAFKELTSPDQDRSIWFFPPATAIQILANEFGDRPDVAVAMPHGLAACVQERLDTELKVLDPVFCHEFG